MAIDVPTPGQRARAHTAAAGSTGAAVNGRRRLVVTVLLLIAVMLWLAWAGPALLDPPQRRQGVLPGVTLEAAADRKGLVVTSVQSNSMADDSGIMVGDRITALDAQPVRSLADAQRYLDRRHPMVVDIRLARRDKPMELIYAFPGDKMS